MAGTGGGESASAESGPVLLDRHQEQKILDDMLDEARASQSSTLVLRGEAGIGKTALLDYAVRQSGDLHVVRLAGIESELELGFAAAHQLLLPFLGRLDQLPGPRRDALRTILGLEDGGPPDRFLVGLAVLTLLTDAAAERPLLLVVDDAQWLDRESAELLAFVARRLHADAIACLFAVREPAERALPLDGLASLQVAGLSEAAARELLVALGGGSVGKPIVDRVVAETGGNPLALAEIAGELAAGRLSGGSPSSEPLPLGRRLEEPFLRRVRDLPADTRTLLLLAAAESSGDPALLWRAASRLGIDAAAASTAEASRLAAFEAGVAFRHPLVRSAVYHGASAAERRRVHGALAAASDPGLGADRRAWHLAAAAVGPDEQVAAELERSANRARDRGGYAAAAAMLARAAELTPARGRRAERHLAAAGAELAAGVPVRARELLQEALPYLAEPLARTEAQLLHGRIRFMLGGGGEASSILLEAARATQEADPARAREMLLEALEAALYAGRMVTGPGGVDVARAARQALPAPSSLAAIPDLLLAGYAAVLTGDRATGIPVLRRAITALRTGEFGVTEGVRWLMLGARAAGELMDDEALHAMAARSVQLAREAGALAALPLALNLLAVSHLLAGQRGAAETYRAEGFELSLATGNRGILGTAAHQAVPVLAMRGREAETRSAAAAQTRDGTELERGISITIALTGLLLLELGLGRYEAALARGLDICDEDPLFMAPSRYLAWSRRPSGPATGRRPPPPLTGSPGGRWPAVPRGRSGCSPGRARCWPPTARPSRFTSKRSSACGKPGLFPISPARTCCTASGCAGSGVAATPGLNCASPTSCLSR